MTYRIAILGAGGIFFEALDLPLISNREVSLAEAFILHGGRSRWICTSWPLRLSWRNLANYLERCLHETVLAQRGINGRYAWQKIYFRAISLAIPTVAFDTSSPRRHRALIVRGATASSRTQLSTQLNELRGRRLGSVKRLRAILCRYPRCIENY